MHLSGYPPYPGPGASGMHSSGIPLHPTKLPSSTTSPATANYNPQPIFNMGSVVLPHLSSGWHVDQAILSEEERIVAIRFGRDHDSACMSQDEVLYKIADKVKSFAAVYVCDIDQVPDFNQMYELYDPCTIMFFFRNKHIMCDFGTGNNNKLNWVLEDKQEMIDILETVYKGAKKGRGLVVSPKGKFEPPFARMVGGLLTCGRLLDSPPILEQMCALLLDYDTQMPHANGERWTWVVKDTSNQKTQAQDMTLRNWQRGLVSLI